MKSSYLSLVGCVCALMVAAPVARTAADPKDQVPQGVKIIDSTGKDWKSVLAEGWHTDKPPYPYEARAAREQGTMNVVIITGAKGLLIKATVLSKEPHPILDVSTAKWAYAHWSGPPFHQLKVPVTYTLY